MRLNGVDTNYRRAPGWPPRGVQVQYLIVDPVGNADTTTPTTISVVSSGPTPTNPPAASNLTTGQNYIVPLLTFPSGDGNVSSTAAIYEQLANGTLVPVITGLTPGQTLSPSELTALTTDPNGGPYVLVYNNTGTDGASTSTSVPLDVVPSPLPTPPTLTPVPSVQTLNATSPSGALISGDPFNIPGMYGCAPTSARQCCCGSKSSLSLRIRFSKGRSGSFPCADFYCPAHTNTLIAISRQPTPREAHTRFTFKSIMARGCRPTSPCLFLSEIIRYVCVGCTRMAEQVRFSFILLYGRGNPFECD